MRRWRPHVTKRCLGTAVSWGRPANCQDVRYLQTHGGCVRGRTGKNRPLGRGWCNRRVTDVTTVTERAKVTDSMTCSCRVAHAAGTQAVSHVGTSGESNRLDIRNIPLHAKLINFVTPKRSKMAEKLGLSADGGHLALACAAALCRPPAHYAQTFSSPTAVPAWQVVCVRRDVPIHRARARKL